MTARAFAFVAGLLGLVLLVLALRHLLAPLVIALAVAYLLSPAVDRLERLGLRRAGAVLAVYAAVALVLGAGVAFLVPRLTDEVQRLGTALPSLVAQLEALVQAAQKGYARVVLPPSLRAVVDNALVGLERWLLSLAGGVVRGVSGVVSALVALVLGPVVAFYLLRDLPIIKERFFALVPSRSRSEVTALVSDMDRALGGFVRGQLLVASIVGLLASLGLTLLGVRFALVLGVVAGVTDLIPYFGPVVGSLPAAGIAFLDSFPKALEVGALYFAIQQLESSVISPHVVGKRVGLHPLTVILALLLGGRLLGFWGLLLAVPVTAVARVVVYHVVRRLGGNL